MTVVADAAIANVDGFQANATKVFANTYVKAQEYNGGVLASKAVDSDFLMTAAYTRQKLAKRNNGFLNACVLPFGPIENRADEDGQILRRRRLVGAWMDRGI